MAAIRVSPKYQVVIPKDVRKKIPIRSGQEVSVIAKNGIIYILPRVPIRKLKGTLSGIPKTGFREKRDRL
jgi:AbrB family looped-hinge helix DNA binding protein